MIKVFIFDYSIQKLDELYMLIDLLELLIVNTYNKKDIILKSIMIIQNQSLRIIEIIIIGEHSTDNSPEIFKELFRTDKRIRYFNHLKNIGVWR